MSLTFSKRFQILSKERLHVTVRLQHHAALQHIIDQIRSALSLDVQHECVNETASKAL
jgi:hypothetical protein